MIEILLAASGAVAILAGAACWALVVAAVLGVAIGSRW